MEVEKYERNTADRLTDRIADRLGERQRKLKQIAAWEQKPRTYRLKPFFWTVPLAACMLVAVVIGVYVRTSISPIEELGIECPILTEYRASSSELTEISDLLKAEEYDEALQRTKVALSESDALLSELHDWGREMDEDEAIVYSENLEKAVNSELRWTYIYLLLKKGKNKQAKKEIRRYLERPEFCDHKVEAERLLVKI